MAKKKKKRTRRPSKPRKSKNGLVRQGVPTPPEVEAQIWVLREERMSLRAIAAEVGASVQTVQRILHRDPERLSTLVRAQAEEREQLWRAVENRGLKTLNHLLDAAQDILLDKNGRRRNRRLSEVQAEFLEYARPWAPVLRMTASDAARHQTALAGASFAGGRGGAAGAAVEDFPDDMTPEQMVDVAIDLGMVDILNPVLKELATERLAQRAEA